MTETEKLIFNAKLNNLFKILCKEAKTYQEIKDFLNTDMSSQKLASEIRKKAYSENFDIKITNAHPIKIKLEKIFIVEDIKKDKTIVTIVGKNEKFSFDCTQPIINEENISFKTNEKDFKNLLPILNGFYCHKVCPEYVWTHFKYLPACIGSIPKISLLPTGYINFLDRYNLAIEETSYYYFLLIKEKGYPEEIVKKMIENSKYDNSNLFTVYFLKDNNIDYKTYLLLKKILINQVKNDKKLDYQQIKDFIIDYISYENNFILDTNKDFDYNLTNFREVQKNFMKEMLAKNLQKLNFLNNIIIDDYIIIVPQSLEDLQNEGKQQNNCVGSYYNKNIMNGENLIYFLRKKETPEKSKVTCRYQISKKSTVESRSKNNSSVTIEQLEIIRKIDEIILEVTNNEEESFLKELF